jgi:hypothetical protein
VSLAIYGVSANIVALFGVYPLLIYRPPEKYIPYSKIHKNRNLVNTPLMGGINPGGNDVNFGDTDGTPGDHHSGKMVSRGSRLTPQ